MPQRWHFVSLPGDIEDWDLANIWPYGSRSRPAQFFELLFGSC